MSESARVRGAHRVLVVEDDADLRDLLSRMLAPHFDVRAAADGESALTELEEEGPAAVVVADYRLPGMSGVELLRRIQEEWPSTVAIVLTGVAEVEVAVEAHNSCDVFRFLTKPCPADELRRAVEQAAAEHERRRDEEALADELRFFTDSLRDFNEALEARILEKNRVLRRLHRFAVELNAARSVQEIAELAADVVHDALAGRNVHVQIWDPERVEFSAYRGSEMSPCMSCVPLSTADGLLGEIVVDEIGPEGEQFRDADREVLLSIASTAAVAVHNEFRRRERDQAQQATILALARLAEQRDNETGRHLERVSRYCELIARGLREEGLHLELITDEWIDDLVRSAPLHDIGKVGIPDSILLKPGKLTPEEWEVMKRHTEIGGSTLDSLMEENPSQRFLAMGRDIALCHHEKWDGSGYPRGVAGPMIPLSARILALADVYDALTTVRPYKPAWSHQEALAWIEERSGQHFDPDVVRVFTARAAEVDEIRRRLADHEEDLENNSLARTA